MPSPSAPVSPPSARATVKRASERASYDVDVAHAILDEGFMCHVGLATDDGPVVIPMLYARDGDRLLLHGSPAGRLLRGAKRAGVCATAPHVDGLVLARSAFHHSVDYRSVVVMGRAEVIDDPDERLVALDRLVECIVPGRPSDARPPNDRELRATMVLALPPPRRGLRARQRRRGRAARGPGDRPQGTSQRRLAVRQVATSAARWSWSQATRMSPWPPVAGPDASVSAPGSTSGG